MVFGRRSLVIFAVGLVLAGLVQCQSFLGDGEAELANASTYKNLSDTAYYVGIDACKNCHYNLYQTYIETGMGQSFGPASQVRSDSKLNAHSLLVDTFLNYRYHPYWEGDSLVLDEFRLDERGDTVFKRSQHINYIVGSGQHTNSHIFEVNGYLYQAPFTYYTQEGTLDFPPGFENGNNTRFGRKIGLECMSCHNAMPELIQGSENRFSKVPDGISCERCHGPGSVHVAEKMAGILVDTSKAIDYSIVNPAKLSADLQFEVCQRCHLQGNTVLEPEASFYDFRPGMWLSEVMTVFLPRYEGGENEFIMASHADRMKLSACYTATDGGFNCISCHNPHVSVHATQSQQYNESCMGCHTSASGEPALSVACAEPLQIRQAANGNDCSACHMPTSSSIDIPHVTVHDHKIQIPARDRADADRANESRDVIRRFLGLTAVNNPNPSARTSALGYLQQFEKFTPDPQFLDSAAVYVQRAGKPLDLVVYHGFLKRDYAAVVQAVRNFGVPDFLRKFAHSEVMNRDAWTVYRAGQCFAEQGDRVTALELYRQALRLAPYQLEFRNKLAAMHIRLGAVEQGIVHLDSLLSMDPLFSEGWVNLGYAHLLMGDFDESLSCSLKALKLEPDNLQAMINSAGAYGMKEDWKTARYWLNRAAEQDPDHPDVIRGLESLKRLSL